MVYYMGRFPYHLVSEPFLQAWRTWMLITLSLDLGFQQFIRLFDSHYWLKVQKFTRMLNWLRGHHKWWSSLLLEVHYRYYLVLNFQVCDRIIPTLIGFRLYHLPIGKSDANHVLRDKRVAPCSRCTFLSRLRDLDQNCHIFRLRFLWVHPICYMHYCIKEQSLTLKSYVLWIWTAMICHS